MTTRCVLGEQLWTAKRRRDFPMALNAASAVFFAGALLAAYKRRFWPLMFFEGTYLLKLWFLDRMTLYYEKHRERKSPRRRRLRPPRRRHPLRDLSEPNFREPVKAKFAEFHFHALG